MEKYTSWPKGLPWNCLLYTSGYEDSFYGEGVCLIEWAELIEELLPVQRTAGRIEKDLEKGFDYRKITVEEIR